MQHDDEAKAQRASCSVFVVDDEPDMAQLIAASLRLSGFRVRTFSDPVEAMKALEGAHPDVVVTDVKMPGVDGMEVLRHARDLHPKSGVIMVSGYVEDDQAKEAVDQGALAFLPKPFSRKQVVDVIDRFLADRDPEAGPEA